MAEDFEVFLSKLGTVPKDKIRYYIHWVRRFLKSCNYQLENINTERISQYLDSLDADEKVAGWQVKQAASDAVAHPSFCYSAGCKRCCLKGGATKKSKLQYPAPQFCNASS